MLQYFNCFKQDEVVNDFINPIIYKHGHMWYNCRKFDDDISIPFGGIVLILLIKEFRKLILTSRCDVITSSTWKVFLEMVCDSISMFDVNRRYVKYSKLWCPDDLSNGNRNWNLNVPGRHTQVMTKFVSTLCNKKMMVLWQSQNLTFCLTLWLRYLTFAYKTFSVFPQPGYIIG